MYRDRTGLYYSYRQSYARHPVGGSSAYGSQLAAPYDTSARVAGDEDRNPLLTGSDPNAVRAAGHDVNITLTDLPPSWADISDEVNDLLALAKKKGATLDKLHQDHLLPGFDDRSSQEIMIENLTMEITQHFRECQRLIARLGKAPVSSDAVATMNKNMQISLATKVQDASTVFRKKQSSYLKRLRGIKEASEPETSWHSSAAADDDLDVSFSQSQIQQSARLAMDTNDSVIRQRESEINQIAQGIIELADIFRSLQIMVIDQGSMLDRIDYNIEEMRTHVKAAETELRQAASYQKSSQKKKLILILSPHRSEHVIYRPPPDTSTPPADSIPPDNAGDGAGGGGTPATGGTGAGA
ncbi:t-SNARE [Dipodascopsis tothii]|uniref:t-SNARE n=1 Tax=Dipodascopsis tothii TaxID=44089 RepID=UPI0034CE2368